MVSCFIVAVIDLGHRVIAVIAQRTDGLIIKITEVTAGNQLKFINVSDTFIRTFIKII
jgi:predicted amino acid-binding ACT domain protein